jgi:hypothetical protein
MSNLSPGRLARTNSPIPTPTTSLTLPHHHNAPPQRNTNLRKHRNAIRRPPRRLDILAHTANRNFYIRRTAF